MNKKKKYYAVAVGKKPGVYEDWFGDNGAETQVRGYPGAKYKSFPTPMEAQIWLKEAEGGPKKSPGDKPAIKDRVNRDEARAQDDGNILMYTDGGCINNPGPGGYGVVIIADGKRKELSRGFKLTTNNRMELTACIAGLETLPSHSRVSLFTDSQYVVNGINKGWARNWKRKGWKRNAVDAAENADLWDRLLKLCDRHDVTFSWVKGHAGHPENERCDRLANGAARDNGEQERDIPYETGQTTFA